MLGGCILYIIHYTSYIIHYTLYNHPLKVMHNPAIIVERRRKTGLSPTQTPMIFRESKSLHDILMSYGDERIV